MRSDRCKMDKNNMYLGNANLSYTNGILTCDGVTHRDVSTTVHVSIKYCAMISTRISGFEKANVSISILLNSGVEITVGLKEYTTYRPEDKSHLEKNVGAIRDFTKDWREFVQLYPTPVKDLLDA